MQVFNCPNCGRPTGHKRALGWGTFFAAVVTGGLWLLLVPLYPLRCIRCGLTFHDANGDGRTPRPVLAGVCATLAERFGLPVGLLRVAFIVGGLLGGWGLLLYGILVLFMDRRPRAAMIVERNSDTPAFVQRLRGDVAETPDE